MKLHEILEEAFLILCGASIAFVVSPPFAATVRVLLVGG